MNKTSGEILERVARERGFVGDFHEAMLAINPRWLEIYLDFGGAPDKLGVISEKLKHLIWITVDSLPAHLYPRGIKRHIEMARADGATFDEIFEAIAIACDTVMMTCDTAMPILFEELGIAEDGIPPSAAAERLAALEVEMMERRGEWPAWTARLYAIAPDYVDAVTDLILEPSRANALDAKSRAFIYLALNASPVVNNPAGVRRHVRQALELGATVDELVEVIQLSGMIAFHSSSVALPILRDVIDEAAKG